MTREEAIKLLVNATFSDEWQGNEDLTTAYNMAIKALSEPTTITENMTNGDVIKAMFPNMRKKGNYCEFFFDDTKAIQTNSYMHVSEHWFNAPYKGNFTTPTRPKAKWIKVGEHLYECSCCGYNYRNYDGQVMKFCMNCGSVMEGGE